jgi:hypothetical protein
MTLIKASVVGVFGVSQLYELVPGRIFVAMVIQFPPLSIEYWIVKLAAVRLFVLQVIGWVMFTSHLSPPFGEITVTTGLMIVILFNTEELTPHAFVTVKMTGYVPAVAYV